MLLSAVSVLVVEQSSSEIPEGLMNNPVYQTTERILRKIYGLTKENGIRKPRFNHELYEVSCTHNCYSDQSRNVELAGHLHRMHEQDT